MSIPQELLRQVKDVRAVPVLGAGASSGAISSSSNLVLPSSGQRLAELLADRFLEGRHRAESLATVAELAITVTDLVTVQNHVGKIFEPFEPAPYHSHLADFVWRALATTNYDQIIEKAYQGNQKRLQDLVPFIRNADRIDEQLRQDRNVALLKLHGCVTVVDDPSLPLILTPEQYDDHEHFRNRLFGMLYELGAENSLIFIGQRLGDSDLRHILRRLTDTDTRRPDYYMVAPSFTPEELVFWDRRGVICLPGTFQQFLEALLLSIPREVRQLAAARPVLSHPIQRTFANRNELSPSLSDFLQHDFEYLDPAMTADRVEPKRFYHGFDCGWSAIAQDLDVRRTLLDEVLGDVFLQAADSQTELTVVKGAAGAGKSVFLRRLAWDATNQYDCICLFRRPHGRLSFGPVADLAAQAMLPIYLVIDRTSEVQQDLADFIRRSRASNYTIRIVTAERFNEWNVSWNSLDPFINKEVALGYLTESEISDLLILLDTHDSLGKLAAKTYAERVEDLRLRAGRQLLVALHEATLGKPFEELIYEEYSKITPSSAQFLYLNICALNQFDVPVRAGLIARLFDIPFERFRTEMFGPLEEVVNAERDPRYRDYVYRARHPHVAEIVVTEVLRTAEMRRDIYMQLLSGMNISYDSDRTAFHKLIRARGVLEQFPDHNMARDIYQRAGKIGDDDPVYHQQFGIYEMLRPNGSLDLAQLSLIRARNMSPRNLAVQHSLMELSLRRAEAARTDLEFQTLIGALEKDIRPYLQQSTNEALFYHTMAKTQLAKVIRLLKTDDSTLNQGEISQAVQATEVAIAEGLQLYPGSQALLEVDAKLAWLVRDEQRVLRALQLAFNGNEANPYLAKRLAESLTSAGLPEEAEPIYERAVTANSGNRLLRFAYGMHLVHFAPERGEDIAYQLRRAFSDGDSNYDAQFWYARQLHLNDDKQAAASLFARLRTAAVPWHLRSQVRGVIVDDSNVPKRFAGRIAKIEPSYAFVNSSTSTDMVFVHVSNVQESCWEQLIPGVPVQYSLGFNFSGLAAVELTCDV